MITSQSYASNIIVGNLGSKIEGEVISTFNYPWSFSFLDNDHLLVATKPGKLWLLDSAGSKTEVKNMVSVEYGGQGGMGDIVPHPNYSENHYVYLSFFFSSRRRHTRSAHVSWARRCV